VTEKADPSNPFEDVERAVAEMIESQLDTVKELDAMEVDVTEWEANFLESVLTQLGAKRALSQAQIEIVRRMCSQYDVECDL
jgi:glutamate formiminotransferase